MIPRPERATVPVKPVAHLRPPVSSGRRAAAVLATVVCLLVTLGACRTSTEAWSDRSRSWIKLGTTTKAEVYARLGIPTRIAEVRGVRTLVYEAAASQGLGLGAETPIGPILFLENDHRLYDILEVRLDDNDVVTSARRSFGTDDLVYKAWPFGD